MSSIRAAIEAQIADRTAALGLDPEVVQPYVDLVQSGLFDSMAFIDLMTAIEESTGTRIDLENALSTPEALTMDGLIKIFEAASNG